MHLNLWTFLTATVIFGALFSMLLVFVTHRKTVKELDTEAQKMGGARWQAGTNKPVSNQAPPHAAERYAQGEAS